MKIIERLEISDFRNISHSTFRDLNHVNVIIGPNNSGKSNVLQAIDKLVNIDVRNHQSLKCKTCREIISYQLGQPPKLNQYQWTTAKEDFYENNGKPRLMFEFNEEYLRQNKEFNDTIINLFSILNPYIERLRASGQLSSPEDRFEFYKEHIKENCVNKLYLNAEGNQLEHGTVIQPELIQFLRSRLLLCPEERLQNYKQKAISDYIKQKDMDADQLKQVQDYMRDIIDSELKTYTSTSLNYLRGPRRFSTPIKDQGSGVRSLICLICDIVSAKEQIILIDEPELGLNQAAKRKFISFLLENTQDKQFFISTHDPTFVNPKLWGREKLSIFIYSIIAQEFVKVSLDQNSQDPNTFGGYLPHTTCIKDYHIYVEGTYDVYIHQVFFNKFIDEISDKLTKQQGYVEQTLSQVLNRVEIYHLGGDFWEHLLHTIPQTPYNSVLIFDGDKKTKIQKAIETYNQNRLGNLPVFKVINKMELSPETHGEVIPVYALSKDNIEQYLNPVPPKDKKIQGPAIAKKMNEIPEEFISIYCEILRILVPELHKKLAKSASQL
ncbi:MAG: AAA family ATPase [Candidatus Bathyarchaeota archaeon]|nr:AAA family ATPase [Candidatus Bathyarchaeota archaeon]